MNNYRCSKFARNRRRRRTPRFSNHPYILLGFVCALFLIVPTMAAPGVSPGIPQDETSTVEASSSGVSMHDTRNVQKPLGSDSDIQDPGFSSKKVAIIGKLPCSYFIFTSNIGRVTIARRPSIIHINLYLSRGCYCRHIHCILPSS